MQTGTIKVRLFSLLAGLVLVASACGGGETARVIDESDDNRVRPTSGGAQIPAGVEGPVWRWVEAHCTEGPLDLSSRGYAATLRVFRNENELRLITDQTFAAENCTHTVMQRAVPPSGGPDWHMEEIARIAVPPERECFGDPEDPRPGTVRLVGGRLEVLVQRSRWCNGYEVRHVFESGPAAPLTEEEIVRRYAAYFTQGDAQAVAALFADAGSLLEPFTQTETGDPYRHDGREAVLSWYQETFATAPWRSLRITNVEEGEAAEGLTRRLVTWEYIDPRLSAPLQGRNRFTIAAGQIFESAIELLSEPQLRDPEAEEAAEASSDEATSDS